MVYLIYTKVMRTNIDLNDELITQAQRFSGLRTKREVVDAALREFVARHRQQQILSLVGEALIDPTYNVRKVRTAMSQTPVMASFTPEPGG
jgi:Arc/MetJ family transcription regulator